MKLTDLDPRWYTGAGDGIIGISFECPHCRVTRLAVPTHHTAAAIMKLELTDHHVVDAHVWQMTGDAVAFDGDEHKGFENVTLTPSVDASKFGHWHGYVTRGEVR